MLGSAECEHPGLISHELIFEVCQTDGQTDNLLWRGDEQT